MPDIMKIGPYQLENLLRNQVRFVYLDIGGEAASVAKGHALLAGSQPVDAEKILEHVRSLGVPEHYPIVLICENGSKSMAVALELEQNSFINVVIVEGGARSLSGGP